MGKSGTPSDPIPSDETKPISRSRLYTQLMLASASPSSTVAMSLTPTQASPAGKRPRLSLQIKTPGTATILGKSVTALKTDHDPSSPTSFNTLSNAYAVAIENSSPRTARPLSSSKAGKPTLLRLETKNFSSDGGYIQPAQRTQTPGPFSITYPDTPSSAFPSSLTPVLPNYPEVEPKTAADSFTFTPPQSAGSERSLPRIFTFTAPPNIITNASPCTPRTPRRRVTLSSQYHSAPYTHPRALHSILRNSPLPPRTAVTPATPNRVSMRLAAKASRRVDYSDPLTQTITTNKYVKSHIDLLAEDSPASAGIEPMPSIETPTLETAFAYTGDETRDGGQTPGPFEEMRRRMAESALQTPASKKRKRREKKRKWEWTISSTGDMGADDDNMPIGRTPLTAMQIERTPITAIRRGASVSEAEDSEMSEVEERYQPEMSYEPDFFGGSQDGSIESDFTMSSVESIERPTTSQSL